MSNYNLTDNVQDGFTFNIRENKYVMRYPRTEEVEVVQELNIKLDELATQLKDAKTNKDEAEQNRLEKEIEKVSKKLEAFVYDFITPEGHQVPIQEALNKENIRVMKHFNTMIRTELSI